MGNSTSSCDESPLNTTKDDEYDDIDDPFYGIDTLGYRVLGVQPNSPAAAAGLVSFLEFLVGADGKMLLGSGEELEPGEEYDDVDFPALLEEKKGQKVELLVWNIKSQSARLVDIIPSDNWGGAGLLGVTIRLDNYAGAEDRLVRVLSIASAQSPAAIAGLVPENDFLLGTTHQTLDSVDRLADVLRRYEGEVVELYVYNTEEDKVRVVSLLPTSAWEGSRGGLLGAEVGTGYLHRLPFKSRNTTGSSIERKVRYVDQAKSSEGSQRSVPTIIENISNEPIQNDQIVQKVLEMEPQLEMEPGEDEDHGGRRPLVSPSAIGISESKEEIQETKLQVSSNVSTNTSSISSAFPPQHKYSVPSEIHTHSMTSGSSTVLDTTPSLVSGSTSIHPSTKTIQTTSIFHHSSDIRSGNETKFKANVESPSRNQFQPLSTTTIIPKPSAEDPSSVFSQPPPSDPYNQQSFLTSTVTSNSNFPSPPQPYGQFNASATTLEESHSQASPQYSYGSNQLQANGILYTSQQHQQHLASPYATVNYGQNHQQSMEFSVRSV